MDQGIKRWIVDISHWNPSENQFYFIISVLPPHERSTITRFVKFKDRKRAFVSRLLQYSLVHEVSCLPFDSIFIDRTLEGKPFLRNKIVSSFPNFNFNVSHHGNYVAIVSEPLYLVGLDIVSNEILRQPATLDFVYGFASYFTALEWKEIVNAGTLTEVLASFLRYWSLKEAFVKAIGAGVGFGLNRLEFHHTNWTNISVQIDGVESSSWMFWLTKLDERHWASIVRGNPRDATETFKKAFSEHHLKVPNEGFTIRTVEELIPTAFMEPFSG
ncbi:4'-phosphopantetheinyl transferase [Apostasia shenzhenica]|uniref:holo-[acyl-carrier-protein] synthase n=1 Tax=Apostasia shenzhenica TaxID=1088818 RepID=A0A2I0BDT3_9ASPA|nr:4'-phosphopantetheinyl transferase [Apostasia shenzhenica]